jgi:hypothetical protein
MNGAIDTASAGCRHPRVPAYGIAASGTRAGATTAPARPRSAMSAAVVATADAAVLVKRA